MRRHKSDFKLQLGFAALEVMIAVVILGIIFVLTLKGASLVQVMRGVMAGYKAQQYQAQVALYQAEHHYLPGDDPTAPGRYHRPESVFLMFGSTVSLVGDDHIDGKLSDALNANGEQFMAWRDLRYAGLIDGDPKLAGESAMPRNAFGGVYGFDEGNLGQRGGSLCLTKVPGKAAQQIDQRLDDGVINKGKVVATSKYDPAGAFNHFDAPDSAPYDPDKEYIICTPILP